MEGVRGQPVLPETEQRTWADHFAEAKQQGATLAVPSKTSAENTFMTGTLGVSGAVAVGLTLDQRFVNGTVSAASWNKADGTAAAGNGSAQGISFDGSADDAAARAELHRRLCHLRS